MTISQDSNLIVGSTAGFWQIKLLSIVSLYHLTRRYLGSDIGKTCTL